MKSIKGYINEHLIKQHITKTNKITLSDEILKNLYENPIYYKDVKIISLNRSTISDIIDKSNIKIESIFDFIESFIDKINHPNFNNITICYQAKQNATGISIDNNMDSGSPRHFCNVMYDENTKDWQFFKWAFSEEKLSYTNKWPTIIKLYGLEK